MARAFSTSDLNEHVNVFASEGNVAGVSSAVLEACESISSNCVTSFQGQAEPMYILILQLY